MPNIKSAKVRVRNSARKRLRNRFQKLTTKRAIKDLLATTDASQAQQKLPKVISLVDKMAKNNIIHKNTAARRKSKLARFVNKLSVSVSAS